jgi:hypothetical protein
VPEVVSIAWASGLRRRRGPNQRQDSATSRIFQGFLTEPSHTSLLEHFKLKPRSSSSSSSQQSASPQTVSQQTGNTQQAQSQSTVIEVSVTTPSSGPTDQTSRPVDAEDPEQSVTTTSRQTQLEFIQPLCDHIAPKGLSGFAQYVWSPLSGSNGLLSDPAEHKRISKAIATLLTESFDRSEASAGSTTKLTEELVSEALICAAHDCLNADLNAQQATDLIRAAAIILEYHCRLLVGARAFNPLEFIKHIHSVRTSIKSKLPITGSRLESKSAGLVLGMLIAATHRYVDRQDRKKRAARNLTAFGVCCFWAWSYLHGKLPFVAAVFVTSFGLYELVVPKLKQQFDANQLRINIMHESLKESDDFNFDVKNGVEFSLKVHHLA